MNVDKILKETIIYYKKNIPLKYKKLVKNSTTHTEKHNYTIYMEDINKHLSNANSSRLSGNYGRSVRELLHVFELAEEAGFLHGNVTAPGPGDFDKLLTL